MDAGVYESGRDGVDADAFGGDLDCKSARERIDRAFTRGVMDPFAATTKRGGAG